MNTYYIIINLNVLNTKKNEFTLRFVVLYTMYIN